MRPVSHTSRPSSDRPGNRVRSSALLWLPAVASVLSLSVPGQAEPLTLKPLVVELQAGQVQDVEVDLGRGPERSSVHASITRQEPDRPEDDGPRVAVDLVSSNTPSPSRWSDGPVPAPRRIDLADGESLVIRTEAHRCSPAGVRHVPIDLEATVPGSAKPLSFVLPVDIKVTRGGSCTPIYTKAALTAGAWIGAGALALCLWGTAKRGAFLSLGTLGQRLVPVDTHGARQEASVTLLEEAIGRRSQRGHRALAFLGWWVRHPFAVLAGRATYSETITLSLGRSSHLIAVSLLDTGSSFEDLEQDPGSALGKLVARATTSGLTGLYAGADAEGRVGRWRLEPPPVADRPHLHRLDSGDSLVPIEEGDDADRGQPESAVEPARWEIQRTTKGG